MMNLEERRIRKTRRIEDIDDNLMSDILSRVDVRTIIYCKCVCKKWHDLVLDPYFVNNMWPKNPNNFGLMIHGITLTHTDVLNWVEIEEEYFDVASILTVDLSTTPRKINILFFGGSAEGLICVWSACHTVYIINPVTKEYMSLPDAPSSLSLSNIRQDTITFGFGVSMGGKAYKVICIYKTSTIGIEVFTLGTDHWRTLEPQDHYSELVIPIYMRAGVFFNGHVHWIDPFVCGKLFVFELDNETFNSFPSPPPVYEEEIQYGCLGVLKGCLSQYCGYPYLKSSVWVMKEYGIKDSWYRAFSIDENIIDCRLTRPLYLIDSLRGAMLILKDGNTLAAYCLQTSTLKTLNLSCIGTYTNIMTAFTYRPTLLKLQNFASPNTVVQTF